jgi:hypothetical protein
MALHANGAAKPPAYNPAMAVFTEVPHDTAAALIHRLGIGELTALKGIASGIENTNYFADTTKGRYVLTLFERLTPRPTKPARSCTRCAASPPRWSTASKAATSSPPT